MRRSFLTKLASHVLHFMRMPSLERECVATDVLVAQRAAIEQWLEESALEQIEIWIGEAKLANDKSAMRRLHAFRAVTLWPHLSLDAGAAGRLLSSVAYCMVGREGAMGRTKDKQEGDTKKADKDEEAELLLASADAGELGMGDQELFSLTCSKRRLLNEFLETSAPAEMSAALAQAVHMMTGRASTRWHKSDANDANDGGTSCVRSEGSLVFLLSTSSAFGVRPQQLEIVLEEATITPIPEAIAKLATFQAAFQDGKGGTMRPDCAIITEKENLRWQVIINEGAFEGYRISVWEPIEWPFRSGDPQALVNVPGMPVHSPSHGTVSYGGQSYGGGQGGVERKYQYGQARPPPEDVSWLPAVLDPLLATASGATAGRFSHSTGWSRDRQLTNVKIDIDLKKQEWWLPTDPVDAEATQCVLLGQLAASDNGTSYTWWVEVRVSRVLQCLDAFVVDVFGRRAFPRQVYASDARFSFSSRLPTLALGAGKPPQTPPPPLVVYSWGCLCEPPINYAAREASDVLIERPMVSGGALEHLLVPDFFLDGHLPGALLEKFDFWQAQSDRSAATRFVGAGELLGERKPEAAKDSFFEYRLRVHERGVRGLIVREEPAGERTLIGLKNVPPGSPSAEIVRLLSRIESLSHVLAWTELTTSTGEDSRSSQHLMPAEVELPRLRMRFKVKRGADGRAVLHSRDRAGMIVMSDQNEPTVAPHVLDGLRYLLCGDESGAREVLVPSYPIGRPQFELLPFSTLTLPRPRGRGRTVQCYTFRVHASQHTLEFRSLGGMLYYAHAKLLARDYEAAFAMTTACVTDMSLSRQEWRMLEYFSETTDDLHPDAHACRLKLRAVLAHAPLGNVWLENRNDADKPILMKDLMGYALKRSHVSQACRLTDADFQLAAGHLPKPSTQEQSVEAKHEAAVLRNCLASLSTRAEETTHKVEALQQADCEKWNQFVKRVKGNREIKAVAAGEMWPYVNWCAHFYNHEKTELVGADMVEMVSKVIKGDPLMSPGCKYGYPLFVQLVARKTKLCLLPGKDCTFSMLELLMRATVLDPPSNESFHWDAFAQMLVASLFALEAGKLRAAHERLPLVGHAKLVWTHKSSAKENAGLSAPDYSFHNLLVAHAKAVLEFTSDEAAWKSLKARWIAVDRVSIEKIVAQPPEPVKPPLITDCTMAERELKPTSFDQSAAKMLGLGAASAAAATLTYERLSHLAARPIGDCVRLEDFVKEWPSASTTHPFPFALEEHVHGALASNTLKRLHEDWEQLYADSGRESSTLFLAGFSPADLKLWEAGGNAVLVAAKTEARERALSKLRDLQSELKVAHDKDQATARQAADFILQTAHCEPVLSPQASDAERERQLRFHLQRRKGLIAHLSLRQLVAMLLSTAMGKDLLELNPFLSAAAVAQVQAATSGLLLVTNRIYQLQRCREAAHDLIGVLKDESANVGRLRKGMDDLMEKLTAERHYVTRTGARPSFDPRFLVFEYTFGFLLRKQQVRSPPSAFCLDTWSLCSVWPAASRQRRAGGWFWLSLERSSP